MDQYEVVCQDCDWRETMPSRETAEHAKRVHEFQYDHHVFLE